MPFYTSSSLLLTTIIALAGCASDPLEPGSGNSGGSGTNSLLVTGRAEGEAAPAERIGEHRLHTRFTVSVSLAGTRISMGTGLRHVLELHRPVEQQIVVLAPRAP